VVLITHMPWETVLDQMTWSRWAALRKRLLARYRAQAKAAGHDVSDDDGSPKQVIKNADDLMRLMSATGGRVAGMGSGF
jgi:hypothetical protein